MMMMRNLKIKLIALTLVCVFATSCKDDKAEFSIVPSLGFTEGSVLVDSDNLQPVKVLFYTNATQKESETTNVTVQVNDIGNVSYGTDYTTDPEAVDGVITLALDPDDDSPGFTVYPLANTNAGSSREIDFQILSVSGNGLSLGQAAATIFTITITKAVVDPNQMTIAAVRAMYTGSASTLTSTKSIQGIVTSVNDNITGRDVYIQDNTGAIVLFLTTSNLTATTKFALGDQVQVPLSGVALDAYNGVVELGNSATPLPNANVKVLKSNQTLPAVRTITVAQLNAGTYQSQLVNIVGATFSGANGTKTVSGINGFTDASGSSTMYVGTAASFASKILPQGSVMIAGLASNYSGSGELLPVSATDIP